MTSGSAASAPRARATISYMMNKMQPGLVGSDLAAGYLKAIYELLG